MAVFNHLHSKFLNLTAGSHKPAQSTPVHHWMSIQCSLGELPLCSSSFVFKELISCTITDDVEEDDLSSGGSLQLIGVIPVPLRG